MTPTPESSPTPTPPPTPPTEKKSSQLTVEAALRIWNLLETRQLIRLQVIKTRAHEIEQSRIDNLLPAFMLQHAETLVSSFLAMHEEYIPLVRALTPALARSQGLLASMVKQQGGSQP